MCVCVRGRVVHVRERVFWCSTMMYIGQHHAGERFRPEVGNYSGTVRMSLLILDCHARLGIALLF